MEQTDAVQPADPLSAAISDAASLIGIDPASAERRALDILKASPGNARALTLLVNARRSTGDTAGACAVLEELARKHPDQIAVHYELGLIARALKDDRKAAMAFSRVNALEPGYRGAWRLLGDALVKTGQVAEAGQAYARNHVASAATLRSLEAAAAAGQMQTLLDYLAIHPTDVNIGLLAAQLEMKLNRLREAHDRLVEILRSSPDFALARYTFAQVLRKQARAEDAIRELDILLRDDPGNVACLNLKAMALSHLGEYTRSLECYDRLLKEDSSIAACWVGYGYILKTVGKRDKAIAAMKKAIALQPNLGEAYWELADLKTFRFSEAETAAMRNLLRGDLTEESRAQIHFALGKALEDASDYKASFAEYAEGNAIRRKLSGYNADETTSVVRRCEKLFTREFFGARAGSGDPSPDPVFIVGLTRSGSTLIEQVLASHPQIEGTAELPTVASLAAEIRDRTGGQPYPGAIGQLDKDALTHLGSAYIARTRVHRKLGRAFFIDKMPSNFLHTGLIHLMLPNAKIVDARRHPLSCGFANFKQHFTIGQGWTYDLEDIGRYYRDYVELMAHFDAVLPARVHRVIYEDMVADPEREVRRLLDYCGLAFDEACLRFYENDRPVLTASAEQVRRPIFKDALEQWRHYEPWLDPMKAALGNVLDAYPAAPFVQSGSRP